ncbi:ester cyclase [Thermodesulfobacteriota bacterium]
MATSEELKRIAHRWIEKGWQKGDPFVVDELHSPNFVDHDPGDRSPDNEGFKKGISTLFRAFPDFRARVEDVVVDVSTSTVSVRWSATGTHSDTYLGATATGKRVSFKGIEIVRIREGRITERWGEWDGIDLLEQFERPVR